MYVAGRRRLVDHMGGIDNAVALVKEAAEIPADEQVTFPAYWHCTMCYCIRAHSVMLSRDARGEARIRAALRMSNP